MSRTSHRRARLLRLREIELRIAKARLARADDHLANLNRITQRIASLKAGLSPSPGAVVGLTLNSLAEMERRLDLAAHGMAASISEAEENRARIAALRIKAQQREDSTAKLHDKARREEEAVLTLRTDANRPHIKRKRFTEIVS